MKQGQIECVRNELRKVKYNALRMIIKEIPPKAGYITGTAISIWLMISGKIGPGDLMAFITLLNKGVEPINGITNIYSNFQKSLRSAYDLLKLVDEPEENYRIGKDLEMPVQSIKFENVSFGYRTKDSNDSMDDSYVPEYNLERDAFVGLDRYFFEDKLRVLAAMAKDEQWNFKSPKFKDPTGQKNFPILNNYLYFTYDRLKAEGKIAVLDDESAMCFNTGLQTKDYERDIYAYFVSILGTLLKPQRNGGSKNSVQVLIMI